MSRLEPQKYFFLPITFSLMCRLGRWFNLAILNAWRRKSGWGYTKRCLRCSNSESWLANCCTAVYLPLCLCATVQLSFPFSCLDQYKSCNEPFTTVHSNRIYRFEVLLDPSPYVSGSSVPLCAFFLVLWYKLKINYSVGLHRYRNFTWKSAVQNCTAMRKHCGTVFNILTRAR